MNAPEWFVVGAVALVLAVCAFIVALPFLVETGVLL